MVVDADGLALGPRARTHHDRPHRTRPGNHHDRHHRTRPGNHDSSSSGYQPTFLTPQSLHEHNDCEDKLHQNVHHVAATRTEQTQRLQRGLQSLGVDIPSDLYQTRVSGYVPYNGNGEASPTNDSNVLYNDDNDEMNDILSNGQQFMPAESHSRPFPATYAMQGMPWKANYFSQNWPEKDILPAHDCVTTETLAPTQSYSNNYQPPTVSPSASNNKEDVQLSHFTNDGSTYEYSNVDNPESSLDGVGEQFASYGADFEKAYQEDADSADCGW